jgi:hypothetical protein
MFKSHDAETHQAFQINQAQLDAFRAVFARNHLPKPQEFADAGFTMPLVEAMQTAYRHLTCNDTSPWSKPRFNSLVTPDNLNEEMALGPLASNYWKYDEGYIEIAYEKLNPSGTKTEVRYFVTTIDGIHSTLEKITSTITKRRVGSKAKMDKEVAITPFKRLLFSGRKTTLGTFATRAEVIGALDNAISKQSMELSLTRVRFNFGYADQREQEQASYEGMVAAVEALPWGADEMQPSKAPAKTPDAPIAAMPESFSSFMVDAVKGDKINLVSWPSLADAKTVSLSRRDIKLEPAQIISAAIVNDELHLQH